VNHAPGPWAIYEHPGGSPGIEGEGFSVVVFGDPDDDCGVHGRTDDEALANARLIAAAPDLLDALKWAERLMDDFSMISPLLADAVDKARAAIAKAEGKA
jgi:ParB-like chromosome segregation protein Spo0J